MYRDSHCKDKTVVRPSYLYTGKTKYLICAAQLLHHWNSNIGGRFNVIIVFSFVEIPILQTKRSHDSVIFTVGIPLQLRRILYWDDREAFRYNGRLFIHGDYHYQDKTVFRLSFVYHRNTYTDYTACLYWNVILSVAKGPVDFMTKEKWFR